MKTLVVSQYFWPENFRINDLVAELKARGHEVTVLTGLPNYPAGRWFDGFGLSSIGSKCRNGVKVVRVPMIRRMSGHGWQLSLNYLSYAVAASVLGPLLCRGHYDVVFVYEPSPFTVGIPASVMRWLKRAPMLFWVQDLWPESLSATGAVRSKMALSLVAKMVRAIYRRCDRVLVQSEGFIAPAIAAGADPASVRYFPNWAEDFYAPVEVAEGAAERAELPDGFRLVFGGNMGAAQSLETILEAAEILKDEQDIKWVMIGDGRRKAWMEEEARKRGLSNVQFFSRKPVEQMPRYFALADVLLATLRPDPVFAQTVPSKVQSYLACGRPVVAALDGEGARLVREAGAGLAVAAGDATALAEAVRHLYQMEPHQRAEMGRAGRAYYETHFLRKRLVDRLEGWMRELVEPGESR